MKDPQPYIYFYEPSPSRITLVYLRVENNQFIQYQFIFSIINPDLLHDKLLPRIRESLLAIKQEKDKPRFDRLRHKIELAQTLREKYQELLGEK